MLFGTDYYPEHWSKDRFEEDLKLMTEAGINQVRMAEFAWSLLEPTEGNYDFNWLDQAIIKLGTAGIRTVLGTPTAAPPKWLMDKHTDIYPIDREGRTRGFGNRHHRCHNNPNLIRHIEHLVTAMVHHYKDNPYVFAWQIDNEIGAHDSVHCYCSHCEAEFQRWLENKYKTIDALNEAWGTVFWSQTYNSFCAVSLPRYGTIESDKICAFNPSLMLDYKRYASGTAIDYQNRQVSIIRAHCSQTVTTNTMQHLVFDEIDYYELSKSLDIVSLDNYPSPLQFRIKNPENMHLATAMCLDFTRGLKEQNFWIMEQQSGRPGWNLCFGNTAPGQIRLWSHQAAAHGAEGLMYFRWRPATMGPEQYWFGILDHDGMPSERYDEVKRTGVELQKISHIIEAPSVKSDIAILTDYDNHWGHKLTPHAFGFNYNELLMNYYSSVVNKHHNIDIISTDADFRDYKLIIAPAVNIADTKLKESLEKFCEAGGHLIMTFLSGTRHKNNQLTTVTFPGLFQPLTGIHITDFHPFARGMTIGYGDAEVSASIWCDRVETKTAKTLATYKSGQFHGYSAITRNAFKTGSVTYVGANMDQTGVSLLVSDVLDQLELKPNLPASCRNVEAIRKTVDGSDYLTLLNHNPNTVTIELGGTCTDLLDGRTYTNSIRLDAYDVVILIL